MHTCPVCGRRYSADIQFCEIDGEALVATSAPSPTVAPADAEPETVVRPRRAQPIASEPALGTPRFTQVRVDIPEGTARTASGPLRVEATGVPDRVYRERPMWPIVTALVAVVVIASGLFLYIWMSQQSDFAAEVSTQISQARVAVADAKARLESLPSDNALRSKLLQLQNWDRELQDLELGRDRTREMAQRAREIGEAARRVGEEARNAGAIVPVAPPVVAPAVPSNTNVLPAAPPSSPTMDPMAGPQPGGSTGTGTPADPAKPADPGAAPGSSPAGPKPGDAKPPDTPPAAKPADSAAPKSDKPAPAAAPAPKPGQR